MTGWGGALASALALPRPSEALSGPGDDDALVVASPFVAFAALWWSTSGTPACC